MPNIVVWFSVRGTEVKGEVVAGTEASKIVFVAGYRPETAAKYRGLLPREGEYWVCALERDTQPGSYRGALIVRPLREAQWAVREVGEPVEGVRRFEAFCLDAPDRHRLHSSAPKSVRQEADGRSAPHQAALQRQEARERLWVGPLGEKFFAEFGQPGEIRPGRRSHEHIELVYPRGEKTVGVWEAVLYWPTVPTDEWRRGERGKVEAKFAFTDIPGAYQWRTVATGLDDGRVSLANIVELLPPAAKQAVIAAAAAAVLTPEAAAERDWQQFLSGTWGNLELTRLREELVRLQAPGAAGVESRSYEADIHYGPSEDEYRPAGSYRGRVTSHCLVVGARERHITSSYVELVGGDKFPMFSDDIGRPVEEIRAELIAERRRQCAELLERSSRSLTPQADERLGTLDPLVWSERYQARHITILTNAVTAWVMEEIRAVSAAQAEWQRFEAACAELTSLREQVSAISSRISGMFIEIKLESPAWHEFYRASLEELEAEVAERRAWIAQAPVAAVEALAQRQAAEEAAEAERLAVERQAEEARERRDAPERERLKELLAFDRHPGAPASRPLADLDVAQRVDAFVKDAIALRGAEAARILRQEEREAYGRARRSAVIDREFPGIDYRGLDWQSAGDIVEVAWWAERLSPQAGKFRAATPATTTAPTTKFVDEGKRWFRCQCGGTQKVEKTTYDRFNAGEEITLLCVKCRQQGAAKK